MAAAAPTVDPTSEVLVDGTIANDRAPPTPKTASSNFEVVVDGKPGNSEEYVVSPKVTEDDDDEVIEPAYYYENLGIPVFTPTMDQFRSFKKFVDKINHYGMQSGIIKIIPPKEWVDSLPPLDEKVKDIKIKNPIEQHIAGVSGEYRQTNLEKGRTFNLPEWRHLCEGSDHQPPARRGERRKGREPRTKPPVSRMTRNRKSIVPKEEEVEEEKPGKLTPPTPTSPGKEGSDEATRKVDSHGRQPRVARAEPTPEPSVDLHGRQPRSKRIHKTARQRAAEREEFDEAWFEGFDYRIEDAETYTPERCEELEKAYWRTLTYNNPLYGADMPGSLFDDSVISWNVAHLENILDCIGKKLPGVNTAYLYMGMWKATFAWHLEDMDLYSINYIHFGAPKQWYSISRKDKERFEHVMKTIYPNDAKKCTEFLRHKTFLVSPSILAHHGIKVNKLVHHQHEFVITFPFGYHSGYNLGYNCAESVNFATESWLEYGRNAKKCECIDDAVFLDVRYIERKLRGEPTDDEEESDSDLSDADEDSDEERAGDFPTPPDSVSGTVKVKSSSRKRKTESSEGKSRRVKMRLKAPAREPCILCPNDIPSEPLLPTDTGVEAHRLCAIYTPETYLKRDEADGRETIAGIENISKDRLALKCNFCRLKKGSCFQCSAKRCTRAYHATCAAAAGVLVTMVDVEILGEDGKPSPQKVIDYRCRFHRPKRPKTVDTEALEDDRVIRAFAESLIKDDIIQMQYLVGEIFAGVVIDNRKEENTVLVRTLPKGELMEVEWKWILAQDPSQTVFPDAILTAPADPGPHNAAGQTQAGHREHPLPDDEFMGEYTWGELIVEQITPSPEQIKVNDKDWWHYLGEQSTECIAKYTEDPKRRVYNVEGDFIKKKPPKPRSNRQPIIRYELTYTGPYTPAYPTPGYNYPPYQPQNHPGMPHGTPGLNFSPYNPAHQPHYHDGPTPAYHHLPQQVPRQYGHMPPPIPNSGYHGGYQHPAAPQHTPHHPQQYPQQNLQQHPQYPPQYAQQHPQQYPQQHSQQHPQQHPQQQPHPHQHHPPQSPRPHDTRGPPPAVSQGPPPPNPAASPQPQWHSAQHHPNPQHPPAYPPPPQHHQRPLPAATGPPPNVLTPTAGAPPSQPQYHHPILQPASHHNPPPHPHQYAPPQQQFHPPPASPQAQSQPQQRQQLPPMQSHPPPPQQHHPQHYYQGQHYPPPQHPQHPQHAPHPQHPFPPPPTRHLPQQLPPMPQHHQYLQQQHPGITDIKAALTKLAAKAAAGPESGAAPTNPAAMAPLTPHPTNKSQQGSPGPPPTSSTPVPAGVSVKKERVASPNMASVKE
ncbi:hypothetical protein EX30DRAFT_374373 [Ascodesmis nigricans]|uniref:[histone H3]-trimethyl-L-lysine(9) demethylase n=1 Tax=Ascodesmis nigricans TaxID=341454 RepID=A0A4S2ML13_9PEZI|nr:hypothetical protein EX30DRAFT_374373 [Ascodesmis nigricans]